MSQNILYVIANNWQNDDAIMPYLREHMGVDDIACCLFGNQDELYGKEDIDNIKSFPCNGDILELFSQMLTDFMDDEDEFEFDKVVLLAYPFRSEDTSINKFALESYKFSHIPLECMFVKRVPRDDQIIDVSARILMVLFQAYASYVISSNDNTISPHLQKNYSNGHFGHVMELDCIGVAVGETFIHAFERYTSPSISPHVIEGLFSNGCILDYLHLIGYADTIKAIYNNACVVLYMKSKYNSWFELLKSSPVIQNIGKYLIMPLYLVGSSPMYKPLALEKYRIPDSLSVLLPQGDNKCSMCGNACGIYFTLYNIDEGMISSLERTVQLNVTKKPITTKACARCAFANGYPIPTVYNAASAIFTLPGCTDAAKSKILFSVGRMDNPYARTVYNILKTECITGLKSMPTDEYIDMLKEYAAYPDLHTLVDYCTICKLIYSILEMPRDTYEDAMKICARMEHTKEFEYHMNFVKPPKVINTLLERVYTLCYLFKVVSGAENMLDRIVAGMDAGIEYIVPNEAGLYVAIKTLSKHIPKLADIYSDVLLTPEEESFLANIRPDLQGTLIPLLAIQFRDSSLYNESEHIDKQLVSTIGNNTLLTSNTVSKRITMLPLASPDKYNATTTITPINMLVITATNNGTVVPKEMIHASVASASVIYNTRDAQYCKHCGSWIAQLENIEASTPPATPSECSGWSSALATPNNSKWYAA